MMKNNKNIRIFIFSVIICVVGISFILYGFYLHNRVISIYNYKIEKSDNYEVLLKPNDFYETEILESGTYYVSNSINAYNINLKYDFLGDKKANLEYDYNINAYLVGTVKNNDNQDKEVWNRKFILKGNTHDIKNNIDKFSIDKQVNIDYQYYNNLVDLYEKEYNITIESVLKIRFNIFYTISLDNNTNKFEDFIELEIPITNTVTEVKENYEKITNGEIAQEQKNKNFEEIIFFAIGGITFIGSSIIIVFIIVKYLKLQQNQYSFKLKNILKFYKDIIININNEPNIDSLKIINILDIKDLINLAEQSQSNILYYNNTDSGEKKFFVIINDYVYIYFFKNMK